MYHKRTFLQYFDNSISMRLVFFPVCCVLCILSMILRRIYRLHVAAGGQWHKHGGNPTPGSPSTPAAPTHCSLKPTAHSSGVRVTMGHPPEDTG